MDGKVAEERRPNFDTPVGTKVLCLFGTQGHLMPAKTSSKVYTMPGRPGIGDMLVVDLEGYPGWWNTEYIEVVE